MKFVAILLSLGLLGVVALQLWDSQEVDSARPTVVDSQSSDPNPQAAVLERPTEPVDQDAESENGELGFETGIEALRRPRPLGLLLSPSSGLLAALQELAPSIQDATLPSDCRELFSAIESLSSVMILGYLDGDEFVTDIQFPQATSHCRVVDRRPLERVRHLLKNEIF